MTAADRIRVQHMLDAAEEAIAIAAQQNRTSFLAVIKDLEIIGEAANKVSREIQLASPAIPWADIVGMRNRLIHAYFGIDPEFVWSTVATDLPALIRQLQTILLPPDNS